MTDDERDRPREPSDSTDHEDHKDHAGSTDNADETETESDHPGPDRTGPATTEIDTDADTGSHELVIVLQQIAASAGDPPEHGLDGVAARRRRRKRQRRGAAATAMTLAVALALGAPTLIGNDHHDVTASDDVRSAPQRAQLPDVVNIACAPGGIDVPVATIRPQADGLHLRVVNMLERPTDVWVESEDAWVSGDIEVASGTTELVQAVPPGVLTVGCRIGGDEQRRQVDLVDVDGIYQQPALDCDEDDQVTLEDLPVLPADEPARSYVVATRAALGPVAEWSSGVEVTEPRGYPEQGFYGGSGLQPSTEVVVDDDETVALVYLAGEDPEAPATPPWTVATQVDVCRDFHLDSAQPTEES
jgi:hypothetical protein